MPDPEPQAPLDAAGEAVSGEPTCRACGAPLEDAQDWCLSCGTATPQAAPSRPGLRSAATVAALTLALVGGAVAASYAALNRGTDATQVAAIPPATTTATVVPTTPPATTPAAPTATTATATTTAKAPTTSTPKTAKAPVAPPTDTSTSTDTSADVSDTTPTTTEGSTPQPRATNSPTTTTTKTTTTKPVVPKQTAITLSKGALTVYDPLGQALVLTDPKLAMDGDPATTFSATTPAGPSTMRIGVVIDLGHARVVKAIKLQTPTPGFSVAIYGAAGPSVPPVLTDTGWKHLHNQIDIGSVDGNASIKLGKGDTGVDLYRYLLVWVTRPPNASPASRSVTATTADAPADTTTTTTPTTTAVTPVTPPPTTTDVTPVAPVTTTTTPTTPAPTPGPTVSLAELSVFG